MAKLNFTQSNFTRGQLDPRLHSRFDFEGFYKGVKEATNVIIEPHGALSRRFGFKDQDINFAKSSDYGKSSFKWELIKYSTDVLYLILFAFKTDDSVRQIKIYKKVGESLSLLQTINVTNITYAQLESIDLSSGANVLFLTHQDIAPLYIYQGVLGEADWKLDYIHFQNLPTYDFDNDYQNAEFKVSDIDVGFNTALTIPSHKPDYPSVKGFFEFTQPGGPQTPLVGPTSPAPGDRYINTTKEPFLIVFPALFVFEGDILEFAVSGWFPAATGTSLSRPSNNSVVQDSVTSKYYRFNQTAFHWYEISGGTFEFSPKYVGGVFSGNEGTMRLTDYVSVSEMQGTVTVAFKNTDTFPGSEAVLAEVAWSSTLGYPSCSSIYQDRLWYGGLKSLPAGLFGSKIGQANYFDFDDSTALPNSAINLFLQLTESNIIKKLLPASTLFAFTTTGTASTSFLYEGVVTATDISFTQVNNIGLSATTNPVFFNNQVIYAANGGKIIEGMDFSNDKQNYLTTDVSILAQNLINNPKRLAIFQNPETDTGSYLLVANDDGTIAAFQSLPAENVAGWSGIESQMLIRDLVYSQNDIYALAEYDNVFHIMKLDFEAFFDLQGSQTLSPASATITGLSKYEGHEIGIKADGFYPGAFTVSGGEVTIPFTATDVEYGYEFSSTIKTMPLNFSFQQNASTLYNNKTVRTLTLDYYNSLGLIVNGYQIPELTMDVSHFDTPEVGKTGFYRFTPMNGWAPLQEFEITHDVPYKFTLRALSFDVEIE